MTKTQVRNLMIFVVIVCVAILGVVLVQHAPNLVTLSTGNYSYVTAAAYNDVTESHNTTTTTYFDEFENVKYVMKTETDFTSHTSGGHISAQCECNAYFNEKRALQLYTYEINFSGNAADVITEYQDKCNQSCIDFGQEHFGL